jgi:Malate synthase G, alpha-beta insertion domain
MHTNVMATPSHRQNGIRDRSQVALNCMASYLDQAIPLQDASHADVVSYSIETIWRKAECIALLNDGRRAKLHDAWQFIGYRGHDPARLLLFRSNGLHIEVQTDTEQLMVAVETKDTGNVPPDSPGFIRRMLTAISTAGKTSRAGILNKNRIYTAVDGSLVSLTACGSRP